MNDESVTFVAHHTPSELLQGPFSSRMLSDVEVKNALCPNLHDHEHINEPKCRCYDDKKVRRNDGLYMIPDESHPALRHNLGVLRLYRHVATDGARRNQNPDFQRTAHWRSVPHPKSCCSLPSQQSISGALLEPVAGPLIEISTFQNNRNPL